MANVAEQAIERSKGHGEIVTIDYDAEAAETLSVECDDSVSANGVTEYWANDPESETTMLWRVHMRDASRYIIECRHASGSSHWDREPDTEAYKTREAAEEVIDTLETEDEEGAALEYRVVAA